MAKPTSKVVKMESSTLEQKVAETVTTKTEKVEIVITENQMVAKLLRGHNDYQDYLKQQNDKATNDSDKKWYKFATKDQTTKYIQQLNKTSYEALNSAFKTIREHEYALNQYVWDEYRNGRKNNPEKTEDRIYIKQLEEQIAEFKSWMNQYQDVIKLAAKAAREENTEKESE